MTESIQGSFSFSRISISKLVNLLTSALFIHSHHIVLLDLSSLITLGRPSLTSRHKIANIFCFHFAPVLWNSLPSDHIAHHVTHSPRLNSPHLSYLSTSLFLKKFKTHFFHCSIPPQSVFTYFSGLISAVLTKLRCFIHSHFIHASFYFYFDL